MPISSWQAISDITAEIVRLNPQSVLDLGVGFGLFGAICRNYLDAMHGRCHRELWTVFIEGIEAHTDYANPQWGVYDNIWPEDFSQELHNCAEYDLVLMIDSLEHLEPEAGALFLEGLIARNKHVIVSVPNGLMEQGAAHGNEYERHRTTFHGPEFDRYEHKVIHLGLCRVVSIPGRG